MFQSAVIAFCFHFVNVDGSYMSPILRNNTFGRDRHLHIRLDCYQHHSPPRVILMHPVFYRRQPSCCGFREKWLMMSCSAWRSRGAGRRAANRFHSRWTVFVTDLCCFFVLWNVKDVQEMKIVVVQEDFWFNDFRKRVRTVYCLNGF